MDGSQVEYSVPTGIGNVFDMTLASDGNLWFHSGVSYVGKMTPSGVFTIYNLGYSSSAGLWRIVAAKDGYLWAPRKDATIARISIIDGTATTYSVFPTGTAYPLITGLTAARNGDLWLMAEANGGSRAVEFGTGYTDNDEDGLTVTYETVQGTSDYNNDTDDDGLSDYVESSIYSARDAVFCDSTMTVCEYPSPMAKDIYIENDWMQKPGVNGYSTQLNSNQVSLLQSAFAAKNIIVHVDTGQLGGGNEVPYVSSLPFNSTSGVADFYDYKHGGDGNAAHMSDVRKDIFHYLVSGYSFAENTYASGVAFVGDDDLFVSYGLMKDMGSYSSFDTAIAGTVMHELGHNLCLSDGSVAQYSGQPASCRFDGIDTQAGSAYQSVMNYSKQYTQMDYSDGYYGAPIDHDDWSAIRLADFTLSNAGDANGRIVKKNPTFKHSLKKRDSKKERPVIGPKVKN